MRTCACVSTMPAVITSVEHVPVDQDGGTDSVLNLAPMATMDLTVRIAVTVATELAATQQMETAIAPLATQEKAVGENVPRATLERTAWEFVIVPTMQSAITSVAAASAPAGGSEADAIKDARLVASVSTVNSAASVRTASVIM